MAGDYKSCNINELLAASTCFQWCVEDEDREAVKLFIRILDLAVVAGGEDYRGKDGLAALLLAAKSWLGPLTLNAANREAVAIYLDLQNAIADGATAPTDEVLAAIGCYRCLDPETKRNLLLYLKCRLNSLGEAE